jgi:hypothetical protein
MQDSIPFRVSQAPGSGIAVLENLSGYVTFFPHQACLRLNHCTLYKGMTALARDYASCVYALGDVASVYCRSSKAKRGHISKAGARVYSDGGVGGSVGTSKGHDLVTRKISYE